MGQHEKYHYSVTFFSDDIALIRCLRGLTQHCQSEGNKAIPWGNTKKVDWEIADHQVTFRFTESKYRDELQKEAKRLLPSGLFKVIAVKDNDPAWPARKK